MSWLNSSLNTIKGQLTNLAQEVLAETAGPGDDDYRGEELNTKTALELLAETQQQKEQLDKECENKDREIATLRKQITKLQNQKISDTGGGGDTEAVTAAAKQHSPSKSAQPKDGSGHLLEDSWCWEPDQQAADKTAAGGNSNSNSNSNALNARILQLEQQNAQLNGSLDELDAQHELAMQKLLQQKQQLQEQLQQLTQTSDELKQQQADAFIAHELALGQLRKQCTERQQAQQQAVAAQQQLQQRVNDYAEELKRGVGELADLQQLLDKRSADNAELIERTRLAEAEREQLQQRVQLLLKDVEELQQAKEKKTSESSNSSSTGKHSEDEFIVVRETDAACSSDADMGSPPSKEKLRDKLVALEARIAELTLENGQLALQLQDRELEKQLSSNVLTETVQQLEAQNAAQGSELSSAQAALAKAQQTLGQLQTQGSEQREQAQKCVAELESRLLISESEKEQLQLELQTLRNDWESKLQQLKLQNQELRLNAEAEQETHDNDAERQLVQLREQNEKLRQELDASIAQAKFRQAIAEEKQEITDLDEADDAASADSYDLDKLRTLLEVFLQGGSAAQLAEQPQQQLEQAYNALTARWQRVAQLEQRLAHATAALAELQQHKLLAEHEKKTLEADISQYILQCDELMKNNELLLNELDKFKRNKLETIEERHEETIVQLEAQLEEAARRSRQLNSELSAARLRIEQLEAGAPSDSQAAQQQLAEQLSRNQTMEAELAAARAHSEAVQQRTDSQLAEQMLLNTELQRNHMELNTELRLALDQLEELQLSSAKEEAKASELLAEQLAQYQQIATDLKQACDRIKQLQASDKQQQLSIEQQLAQIDTLQAERAELSQQLEAAKQQTLELQAELQQAQTQLQDTQSLDELQQTKQQLAASKQQMLELQAELQQAQTQLQDAVAASSQVDTQRLAELQQSNEQLSHEKAEMIKALQQKHAETTQYYAEIQRLQPLAAAAAVAPPACTQCPALQTQLEELCKQQEKLQDQIKFLKEKSDILTTNLLTEQTNQRLLQQEKADALEQQATALRDAERLRAHLLEVEELHTQETVELQQELHAAQQQLQQLQEEVSKSSTAYTSASIRANQQAETLQTQHGLLLQQRDELLQKLGQLEDRELKQQAALTNLQCALEQFQNDKEHDIQLATQRIRKELQLELEKQSAAQFELAMLQQQLADANKGLRAATRLSDQLEAGQLTIAVLRDEVDILRQQNAQLEQRLSSSESSQTDKIDKSLIKSLLIGYVVSGHAGDKQQVLRMISSLLDFSPQETDKVGLNKPQSSWLGAILGNPTASATADSAAGKENLMQAFVQFLEQESQPQTATRARPTLLSMSADGGNTGNTGNMDNTPAASSEPPQRRSSNSSNSSSAQLAAAAAAAAGTLHSSTEFVPARNSSSILKDILRDS